VFVPERVVKAVDVLHSVDQACALLLETQFTLTLPLDVSLQLLDGLAMRTAYVQTVFLDFMQTFRVEQEVKLLGGHIHLFGPFADVRFIALDNAHYS